MFYVKVDFLFILSYDKLLFPHRGACFYLQDETAACQTLLDPPPPGYYLYTIDKSAWSMVNTGQVRGGAQGI